MRRGGCARGQGESGLTGSNLAIDGGHELCSEIYNKGVMPHLTALMGKVRRLKGWMAGGLEGWKPGGRQVTGQQAGRP